MLKTLDLDACDEDIKWCYSQRVGGLRLQETKKPTNHIVLNFHC